MTAAAVTTIGFGLCLAISCARNSPAAPSHPAAAAQANGSQVAQGKTFVTHYRCNTCHGADLAGKKGFSPSLHASGVLREYNPTTWKRVLDTGITNDGGKVHPPMPVYHLKAADSLPIYAYLKTLK
jgi:mono/diheme cytochrome c family protein